MKNHQHLNSILFLILITLGSSTQLHASNSTKAKLTIQYNGQKKTGICRQSIQNCAINVTQNNSTCLAQPGSITVTNNSRVAARNITAASVDSNFTTYIVQNNGCPASLAAGSSCIISFYTNNYVAFITPNVLVQGTNTNAAFFDINAFICAGDNTTLSVGTNQTIAVNGLSTIAVTNTGSTFPAYNVSLVMPGTWTNVVQNASNCRIIAPGATCQLSFTSPTPYVVAPVVALTGSNIVAPPNTAVAFTIAGYFVISVDSPTSATVLDTNFLVNNEWGQPAVTTGAVSVSDGFSNTSIITSTPGVTPSAAVDCYLSNHGGAAVGTWYLPALCQQAATGFVGCPITNTMDNLFQAGFSTVLISGQPYWSSVEDSVPTNAVITTFITGGTTQQVVGKFSTTINTLCTRSIAY